MIRVLAPEDLPQLSQCLSVLRTAYNGAGRYADALRVGEELLETARKLVPVDDELLATTLDNMGLSLNGLGRPAEALPRHEEALAIRRRLYPGDHSLLVTIGAASAGIPASRRAASARAVSRTGDISGATSSSTIRSLSIRHAACVATSDARWPRQLSAISGQIDVGPPVCVESAATKAC